MKRILDFLLDWVFPQSEIYEEIKNWQEKDFLEKAEIFNGFDRYKIGEKFLLKCFAIFSYKDKYIREAVWQIKFKSNRHFAEIFGKIIYKKIIENYLEKKSANKIILIPLPIHKKRRQERGFNQTEWLCEEIMKIDQSKIGKNILNYQKDFLIRDKYSIKQSWSKKKERIENIDQVFKINPKQKEFDRKIILLDDVYTTGSTLKSACLTLLERSKIKNPEITAICIAH